MDTGTPKTIAIIFYMFGLILAALATWNLFTKEEILLWQIVFGALGLLMAIGLSFYLEHDLRFHHSVLYGLMALGLGMLLPTVFQVFAGPDVPAENLFLAGLGLLLLVTSFLRLT